MLRVKISIGWYAAVEKYYEVAWIFDKSLSFSPIIIDQIVFGKNSCITNEIASIRGNPKVTAALEKNPFLKNLETAAVNYPSFMNTMKKDPTLVK